MNRWQKIYCDTYYNGKLPRSKSGKADFELLGNIKETVTVELPSGTQTLVVTEDDCDVPNGKIDVCTLLSNLKLWNFRGYDVTSK